MRLMSRAVKAKKRDSIPVTNGLVMFLDASDTSTMTLTGTRVDEWRDKLGSGNKVATSTLGTSFNPSRNAALFGNRGGVVFPSAGRYLETAAAFTSLNWNNGFTVLAVVKKTSRNGYFYAASQGQTSILGVSYSERLGTSTSGSSGYGFPRNEECVIGCQSTNVNTSAKYILDGNIYSLDQGTGAVGSGSFGRLQIGGLIGTAGFGIYDLAGIVFYNRILSSQEISDVTSYFKNKYGISSPAAPTWNVVIDGNSHAIGYLGTNSSAIHDGFSATTYAPKSQDSINMATAGIATPALITRAASRIDTLYNTSINVNKRIVIVWEGTNDLALTSNRTDVQAYNNLKTYCQARKAAGWKVIIGTILPRTPTGASNTNYETYRLSVNTMIRNAFLANEGWADAIADVGGDATIGATGAYSNTTYFATDGIHLKDAGHNIAKTYFTNAINSIVP